MRFGSSTTNVERLPSAVGRRASASANVARRGFITLSSRAQRGIWAAEHRAAQAAGPLAHARGDSGSLRGLFPQRRVVRVDLRAGEPLVEPRHDVLEPFDAVPRLPRSRQLVRLAG